VSLPADGLGLMDRDIELSGYYLIERTVGDQYIWERGNEYEFNSPGDTRFQFGADKEIVMCQGDHGLGIYNVGTTSYSAANAIANPTAAATAAAADVVTTAAAATAAVAAAAAATGADAIAIANANVDTTAAAAAAATAAVATATADIAIATAAAATDTTLAAAGNVNGVASSDSLYLYKKEEVQTQNNILKNRNIDDAVGLLDTLHGLRSGLEGYQSFDDDGTVGADKNAWDKKYTRYTGGLTDGQWNDLLDNKSQLRVAKHNTFNIQNGNIFDFGGYWNYDLGNSYAEVHGKQVAEINKLYPNDIAAYPGPHWKKIKGKKLTFDQQGDEQVEKLYSNQYSYTLGDTIEVQKGDAESQHYGDSHDYHTGKSYDYHTGNSHEEHIGNSYSLQHGRSDEFFMGGKSEFNLAGTTAMSLAVTSDIQVGGANDIFIGVSSDISVAAKIEVAAGQVISITAGILLEVNAASKIETDLVALKMQANKFATHAAKMDSVATSLKSEGLELTAVGTALSSGLIRMFC
jgi:hypothetical protein